MYCENKDMISKPSDVNDIEYTTCISIISLVCSADIRMGLVAWACFAAC